MNADDDKLLMVTPPFKGFLWGYFKGGTRTFRIGEGSPQRFFTRFGNPSPALLTVLGVHPKLLQYALRCRKRHIVAQMIGAIGLSLLGVAYRVRLNDEPYVLFILTGMATYGLSLLLVADLYRTFFELVQQYKQLAEKPKSLDGRAP